MDPATEEEFHRNLLLSAARGYRQRAQAAITAAEPERGGDTALITHLLLKWAHGHRAAQEVNHEWGGSEVLFC